ncbi:hypothetical protein BGZ73_008908 [Actinomortierella ambigua]|nr:hypothetical protein BGZ73_008908 [Actinomortierella ambigua]
MPHFHRITHLEIDVGPHDEEGTGEGGPWHQYLDRLLETTCRKLESLAVRNLPGISPKQLVPLLVQKPGLAQNLRMLTVYQHDEPARSTKILLDLLVGLPQLGRLEFYLGDTFDIDHDDLLLASCTFRLKSLDIIVNQRCRVSDPIRIRFWKQCSFLSDFPSADYMDTDIYEDFISMFDARDDKGQPVRHVDTLCFPFSHPISEQHLVRILRGCARERLSVLSIGRTSTGPEVFKVLLETQSTTLKALFMAGATVPGFNSSPWI